MQSGRAPESPRDAQSLDAVAKYEPPRRAADIQPLRRIVVDRPGRRRAARDFDAIGAEAFVPPNLTEQLAIFTLQEWTLGALGIEAAARWEATSVEANTLGIKRSFDAFSGALGASYDLGERSKITLSVSRAERAPSGEELFSDGPHIATQAFEIGDPGFDKEKSWGAEASLKLGGDRFNLAVTGYYNWFDGFIFADATGDVEDDLPVFQYRQQDARVWGFEAEASARAEREARGGGRAPIQELVPAAAADDVQAARARAGELGEERQDLGVTAREHGGEAGNLLLAAAALAGLLGIALGAHVLDDVFTLELLLHAAQRTVDRLVLTHLDLDRHGKAVVLDWIKVEKEPAASGTVKLFFPEPTDRSAPPRGLGLARA